MTDEERQRQMDFIVGTLAQLTSKMDALADSSAAAQIAYERRFSRLEDNYEMLARLAEQQDSRMEQIETNVVEISAGINKLVGAQSESNERLNVFINVLERYISGGNGAK